MLVFVLLPSNPNRLSATPKITALAITLNEADNLPAFLDSLDFVDEIVIVDSFSTDGSAEICQAHPKVRFLQRKFDDFSSQKNFAIEQATSDWVLFFDPDEEITPAIRKEIQQIIQEPKHQAYQIRRQIYFMGKKLRYSGFQSDWVVRLFHKEHNLYNGRLVHETIDTDGSVGRMNSRLPHHSYRSFQEYTAKLDQYGQLQAQMMYDKGKRAKMHHFWLRPAYRFWHQYLLRLGILDGKEGFILAYINANSVFKRYVNLLCLERNID